MGDTTLSQEEINALFETADKETANQSAEKIGLSAEEIDTIGEISNICMGTAATSLFALVNRKVDISTPVVSASTWEDIMSMYEKPCVLVKIGYTKGLNGSNILVMKETDVKVITSLMMGGDGTNVEEEEISDLHLSAICEAMNQMMGASATSLSSMLNMMIDISPPSADLIDMTDQPEAREIDEFLENTFIKIEFKMVIDDLVDSKIMQMYPVELAQDMVIKIKGEMQSDSASTVDDNAFDESAQPAPAAAPASEPAPAPAAAQPAPTVAPQATPPPMMMAAPTGPPVDVQAAQFQPFTGEYTYGYQPENIDLIMDVPLEVTVELGRTSKSIEEILDFTPGAIIELNKIAGEPIDVLVNGKYVAKGEVVVIEEAFGVRITEIIK